MTCSICSIEVNYLKIIHLCHSTTTTHRWHGGRCCPPHLYFSRIPIIRLPLLPLLSS